MNLNWGWASACECMHECYYSPLPLGVPHGRMNLNWGWASAYEYATRRGEHWQAGCKSGRQIGGHICALMIMITLAHLHRGVERKGVQSYCISMR